MKTRNTESSFSADQLRQALKLKLREQIEDLEKELEIALRGGTQGFSRSTPARSRMTVAVRRKIAAGQKARWAKKRGQDANGNGAARPKRSMSAARRAKLAAAARARWAKAKAAGRSSL